MFFFAGRWRQLWDTCPPEERAAEVLCVHVCLQLHSVAAAFRVRKEAACGRARLSNSASLDCLELQVFHPMKGELCSESCFQDHKPASPDERKRIEAPGALPRDCLGSPQHGAAAQTAITLTFACLRSTTSTNTADGDELQVEQQICTPVTRPGGGPASCSNQVCCNFQSRPEALVFCFRTARTTGFSRLGHIRTQRGEARKRAPLGELGSCRQWEGRSMCCPPRQRRPDILQ